MQREPQSYDEVQVPMAPSEPGIGPLLAQARMAQGLSLEDVAAQLKFGVRQLEALEDERFEELPGSTFARGMVRGYARLLKLDAAPLLAKLDGRFEIPDANRLLARYSQPVPFSDSSRRSSLVYAVLSVVVLGVVAVVAFEWQQERSGATRLTFVPAARAPAEPAKPAAESSPATAVAVPETPAGAPGEPSAPAAPKRAAQAPVKPAPDSPVATPKPPAAAAAKAVEEGTAAKPASPAGGSVEKPVAESTGPRVVFRFEEESWVEVSDATGRTLMAQLNPAGSVRVVRGEPPFSLVIGNAQHVQVVYRDKIVDLKPHTRVEVARFTLE